MVADEKGAYTDCFGYRVKSCAVLKEWYNPVGNCKCEKCPFFKTHAQIEEDKKRYPSENDYKNRKG